jgi:integrase
LKTKNKRPRTLELSGQVLQMFRDFSKVRRIDNDFVFAGKAKNHTEFRKPFQKALKMAQIENFSFHGLRHTFGTYMALNGMQQNKISSAMGHVQTRSTERYLHLRPEQTESAGIMETLRKNKIA